MGRGKVEMKRIENPRTRRVTFGKRKIGLFKKAREISVMCDSEVALIIFSDKGKPFQFSTGSRMEQILKRHETYSYGESQENWSVQYPKLLAKVQVLEKDLSHLVGEDLDYLRLRELQRLEKQHDQSLKRIRGIKNHMMNESISELQTKEKALSDKNRMLAKKATDNFRSQIDQLECVQLRLAQSSTFNFFALTTTVNHQASRNFEPA